MVSLSARIVGIIALALSSAACTTTGGGGLPSGQTSTVAFDRVDGLPPAVFDRYVRKLNDEAEAKRVPVVTREGFAPYRIKGYVSLWTTRKREATLSWVWEVFDAEGQRVMRISGDEKAGKAGRDAWQAVSDEVLARAARNGMEQLSEYFRAPDSQGTAVAAAPPEPAPQAAPVRPAPSRPASRGDRVASAASLR